MSGKIAPAVQIVQRGGDYIAKVTLSSFGMFAFQRDLIRIGLRLLMPAAGTTYEIRYSTTAGQLHIEIFFMGTWQPIAGGFAIIISPILTDPKEVPPFERQEFIFDAIPPVIPE